MLVLSERSWRSQMVLLDVAFVENLCYKDSVFKKFALDIAEHIEQIKRVRERCRLNNCQNRNDVCTVVRTNING